MRKFLLALLILSASMLSAQTWYKVANQDQVFTITGPAIFRWGANEGTPLFPGLTGDLCSIPGGCWTIYTVLDGQSVTYLANPNYLGNPAPNTPKEIDVQETDITQLVTVAGAVITVPALTLTMQCPAGTYEEIAGGNAGMTATLSAGTYYATHSGSYPVGFDTSTLSCTLAADGTNVDMSQSDLLVLRSTADQTITINWNAATTLIDVPPL